MKINLFPFVVIASAAWTAPNPVHAQLASIGPFPGALTESFESISPGYTANPLLILGGVALVEIPPNDGLTVWEPLTFGFSLGSSSQKAPGISAVGADGRRGLGIEEGFGKAQGTFTFTTPVSLLGAFWGAGTAETNPTTITLTFFDSANNSIGAPQSFSYLHPSGDGVLEWHGWASAVPIAKVTLLSTGSTAVMDDLRIARAPHLSSITRDAGGVIRLVGQGLAGVSYQIQATTNLTSNWVTLGTAKAQGNGVFQFGDTSASSHRNRFYRSVE